MPSFVTSRNIMKSLVVIFALLCVFAAPFGLANANADDSKRVAGGFITQAFGGPTCPSPVGVCSAGTVTGDLAGTDYVVITSSAISPDGSTYSYTATIKIATSKGDLYGTIVGSVQTATGKLSSVVTIKGGTKRYHEANGKLNVTGLYNFATGAEQDSFTGVIKQD